MLPDNVESAILVLIGALSIYSVIFFLAALLFLGWGFEDILPALEHIILSIRTAGHSDVPDDVISRISKTLVPFGRFCSKLLIISVGCAAISKAISIAEWQAIDWDQDVKSYKTKKKRKIKQLEKEIAQIQRLSDKATIIAAASKNIDQLADKVERLRLEASKSASTKVTLPAPQPKTAELFHYKQPVKSEPPKSAKPKRPEF